MNVSVRIGNRRLAAQAGWFPLSLRQALFVLGLITASCLFYLYTEVRALNISYQVSQATSVQRELLEIKQRLKVELNNLLSPERLEREGARLGLAPPPPGRVRVLP
ncbi:MAG: hypothetical protein AB1814_05800 [Thermodesulfobacteriota bacterium]